MVLGGSCLGDVWIRDEKKSNTSQALLSQTQGAWVLENGFSIETWGWNLICNLSIINFIDFSQKSYNVAKEDYQYFLLA